AETRTTQTRRRSTGSGRSAESGTTKPRTTQTRPAKSRTTKPRTTESRAAAVQADAGLGRSRDRDRHGTVRVRSGVDSDTRCMNSFHRVGRHQVGQHDIELVLLTSAVPL